MNHGDAVTFLHEFGHLIHGMYGGHTKYGVQSMGNLQWDFIEAPSQLLEEWTWDYDTLKTFASNDKGEVIDTPVKRLLEEPIEGLRERVALHRKAKPAPKSPEPPESGVTEIKLSKDEQVYCTKHGLTPEQFAAKKASSARKAK